MHTKFQADNRKGKPRGRSRLRREDNIRMDLSEIGWEGVDWMNLAHDSDQ